MAGLISGTMQEQAAPAPVEDDSFTPDQQDQLDTFSLAAQKILFDEGGASEKMAETLKNAPDLPQSLADMTYGIVGMIDEKSGGMLEEELMAAAAADVLGQIAEVAQAAGMKVGGREIAKATQIMLARFFSENGATPDDVQQFMSAADSERVGSALDERDAAAPQEV